MKFDGRKRARFPGNVSSLSFHKETSDLLKSSKTSTILLSSPTSAATDAEGTPRQDVSGEATHGDSSNGIALLRAGGDPRVLSSEISKDRCPKSSQHG